MLLEAVEVNDVDNDLIVDEDTLNFLVGHNHLNDQHI